MNKKITLSFIALFFCFANINATNIIKICINTELNAAVAEVEFTITGSTTATQIDNDINGCYQFEVEETAGTISITPSKNIDPLNGVDVADLFDLRNHILGIDFISPFQEAASDVNLSGVMTGSNVVTGGISTLDLVLTSKAILVDSSFPLDDIPSWIFFEPNLTANGNATIVNNIQLTTPLNGDVQIDLLAAKSADTNTSADPVVFNPIPTYDLPEKLTFQTPNQLVEINNDFEVVFSSDNLNSIIGSQFTVKFDPDKIQFKEFNHEVQLGLNENLEYANNGIVNLMWIPLDGQPITMPTDQEIFKMTFRAKDDIQLSDVITFNSASTLDIAYNANKESMEVELLFDAPTSNENLMSELVKFENFPNPFQTSTQIEFNLPTNEYVKLEITDALGRYLETLIDGQQTAGKHQMIFAPKHLPSGVYWSRLTIGENILTQKIIKM